MAEGEFALIHEYGEAGLIRPSKGWATFGEHDLYSLLVDTAVRQRDETNLRRYLLPAEESARRYDHKLYQAIVLRAQGLLHRWAGDHAEAETHLNSALDMFSALNTGYQIGRTLFELGEAAAAQTATDRARDYFNRALESFESLRAVTEVARVQDALENLT